MLEDLEFDQDTSITTYIWERMILYFFFGKFETLK